MLKMKKKYDENNVVLIISLKCIDYRIQKKELCNYL